ncbi:Extragenic suppressor of kinetochore protein 1 [Purpureocillium lavendulum]|uniref:Succinate dehydrogenase assembly factor 4, mitochondrial n=1 Tax=Purpureocillium lavendulum TaxID=1247861 RepID=A0AB34FNG2_9HYPO|nr:Extragenic suppressor of kinetochore protein 1 [Purpureocillium lavendulum]
MLRPTQHPARRILALATRIHHSHARPSSSFTARPSPPKLPADQQAEFERLQRAAAVSSAFQQQPSSSSSSSSSPSTSSSSSSSTTSATTATSGAATPPSTAQSRHATNPVDSPTSASASASASASTATTTEEAQADVNQGLFRGAPPEFEGDVNPKTGEVGGPKNEPLRWGGGGDWSYNGRVTDF